MTRPSLTEIEAKSASNRAAHAPRRVVLGSSKPNPTGRPTKERDVLKAVLRFMKIHPAVDWAERMNTGAARIDNRFIRYGFPGLSDIIGQLRDGRLIVVETKSSRGKLTPAQAAFVERVGRKGISIVARSLDDVKPVLDGLLKGAV